MTTPKADKGMLAEQAYSGYRGTFPAALHAWENLSEADKTAWQSAVSFLIITGSDGREYLLNGTTGFLLSDPVEIPG